MRDDERGAIIVRILGDSGDDDNDGEDAMPMIQNHSCCPTKMEITHFTLTCPSIAGSKEHSIWQEFSVSI